MHRPGGALNAKQAQTSCKYWINYNILTPGQNLAAT